MGIFDNLIEIDEDGNIKYSGWIEWKHVSMGIVHCPICFILDKCWFDSIKKPLLPQHEKCHCTIVHIPQPIPNVNSKAECLLDKFTEYIFSDKYAWNGKKKLFESLGFNIKDSRWLKQEYEKQALKKYCNSDYILGKLDVRGQRINIDIEFNKDERSIVFTSGWMIRRKGLITNNTPLGG